MQRVYCHSCLRDFSVSGQNWDGSCPACEEGFVEVVGQDTSRNQAGRQPEYQTSFRIPGGVGTVHVVYGSGPHLAGMSGHFPGGAVGPSADPFEMLRAFMGGDPFGGQDSFLERFGSDYNQEQMDQIVTQIMNQYQPQTQETSRRVRNSLPRLLVRPSNSKTLDGIGEVEMGTATVCAGEPCSVCHDEFEEGQEVVELPCNHCFHDDCLMPWLEEHNTCPICRLQLPTEQDGHQSRRNQHQQHHSSDRQTLAASEGDAADDGRPGFFNQLLHNIAERWQIAHVQDDEVEAGNVSATRTTSSSGAAPNSPRSAAARAATARAAASSEPTTHFNPRGDSRTARQHSETHLHSRTQDSNSESEAGESSMQLGMAVGGALAALAGAAVSAFMGRNRQPRNFE